MSKLMTLLSEAKCKVAPYSFKQGLPIPSDFLRRDLWIKDKKSNSYFQIYFYFKEKRKLSATSVNCFLQIEGDIDLELVLKRVDDASNSEVDMSQGCTNTKLQVTGWDGAREIAYTPDPSPDLISYSVRYHWISPIKGINYLWIDGTLCRGTAVGNRPLNSELVLQTMRWHQI